MPTCRIGEGREFVKGQKVNIGYAKSRVRVVGMGSIQ